MPTRKRSKRSGKRSRPGLKKSFWAGGRGFAFIEVALASVIVSLVILSFLFALQMTMKGTISAKWRNQALQLAKDRVELIKSGMTAGVWEEALVDTQANNYNAYPPVTVTLASGQSYIVDATVRYVDLNGYDAEADPSNPAYHPTFIPPPPGGSANPPMGEYRFPDPGGNTWSANNIVYVPTPRPSTLDREFAEVVLIRVDVYWKEGTKRWADIGPPLYSNPAHPFQGYNEMYLENIVTSRKVKEPSGTLQVYVSPTTSGCTGAIAGANVYLIRADTNEQVDLATSDGNGMVKFENVPASPPNYFVISKNNEALKYGDDLDGPTGHTSLGYVVSDGQNAGGSGSRLCLPPLTGGTVTGCVYATNASGTTVAVAGAQVVCNDAFSSPTTTNAAGCFSFSGTNQVELGSHLFWANVWSSSQTFLTTGPTTSVGAQGGPYAFTVDPDPLNGPQSFFMPDPFVKTNYVLNVVDPDGNCLGSTFPVTVRVNDGAPYSGLGNAGILGNWEEDTSPYDCYVTVALVGGTHLTDIQIYDTGARDWKPLSIDVAYNGTPGSLVTIGTGASPAMLPPIQPVATASGSVTGFLSGFDYSIFQVGLYTADPSEDLVYSFPVMSNGLIRHQNVPTNVTIPAEYHIKLITGPEYSVDPTKLSNIQFTKGVTTLLGDPTFTVYKDRAYITGQVKNSLGEVISTGVMVLAVPAGSGAPASFVAGMTNTWATTSTEDGRYTLPLPVAVMGSTYDLYGYHVPRKVAGGGLVTFTSSVQVFIPNKLLLPANNLTAPLTVDFSGGSAFTVATGFH